MCVFVQKKIKRGFLKKHLMQGADDEKVVTSRDTLRKWTTKLDVNDYVAQWGYIRGHQFTCWLFGGFQLATS